MEVQCNGRVAGGNGRNILQLIFVLRFEDYIIFFKNDDLLSMLSN